jgi:hypothetical protein
MRGRLTGNIARLASQAADQGKSVVVVTTNYDQYLEDSVVSWIKDTNDNRPSGEPVHYAEIAPTRPLTLGRLPSGTVNLVYLHGRVLWNGTKTKTALVLNEKDYAKARPQTVKRLKELLALPNTGFVTVGASLTDPPLIEALAMNPIPSSSCRYALVPARSMGIDKAPPGKIGTRKQQVQQRATTINIDLLVPDFNIQVAQFMQELLTAISVPKTDSYRTNHRYSVRLGQWWDLWNDAFSDETFDERLYRSLREGLDEIASYITSHDRRRPITPEHFKLELWVRQDPTNDRTSSGQNRVFTRVGTSIGPNFDHLSDPASKIEHNSVNPAIRAFVEGKPIHIDASQLDNPDTSIDTTWWKSYLAVPIWLSDSWVPVAVLVLASTASLADSALPLAVKDGQHEVVAKMIEQGRQALNPNTDSEQAPAVLH